MQQQWFENLLELPDGRVIADRYGLWPKQVEFSQTRKRYVLFGGARGPGKTVAIVHAIKRDMLRWPGIPVLLLRKDLKDLKQTVLPEIQAKWPRELYEPKFGGQWNKSESWMRFPNGSLLRYGEAKDWESYKSQTNGKVYIEEANEVEEELFLNIDPTLRWIPSWSTEICKAPECAELDEEYQREHFAHPFYQIVMASNPAPGWLKERFWDPWNAGEERKDHAFIPATAFDNPSLPPDFIPKLMENHTATWVQNYIHGDWSSFEDMVWPRFARNTHCWRGPIPFGDFLRVEGGIDWGGTTQEAHRTCAYLTGYLRDGRYVTFWEYSKQGAASADLFAELAAKTKMFKVARWWADASQHRASALLRQSGVPVVDADRYKGAVKDGINHVDRLLTERPTPGGQKPAGPQLYVVETACPRLVSGIETYRLDPDTGEPAKNQEDDEVNAWRYNVMGITLAEGIKAKDSQDWSVRNAGGSVKSGKPSGMLARVRDERRERMKRLIAMAEDKR